MASPSPHPGAPIAPIIVPELQAGGGVPTSKAPEEKRLRRLSGTALSYIKSLADGLLAISPEQRAELEKWTLQSKVQQDKVDTSSAPELFHFMGYMTSELASAMGAPPQLDLGYPLSSYFISSSHNSYLSGNQLWGDASAEVYKNILARGCRCVEIDVWDGHEKDSSDAEDNKPHGLKARLGAKLKRHRSKSPHDRGTSSKTQSSDGVTTPQGGVQAVEPRVLHGHTLTKEVSFRDVCLAIKEGAFLTSDLPVIVSLEIHAGPEQQQMMVEIMEETWRGMLLPPLSEECLHLPTPGELRKKILVKVKAAPKETAPSRGDSSLDKVATRETVTSSSEERDADSRSGKLNKQKKNSSKIIRALSSLGIYTQSYHFKNLSSREASIPTHVFSLSERKLMEVHEDAGGELFSHNKDYLMRVYPSGTRVSSSNLDPTDFWSKGVQIVALNWQRFDAGVMLNEGQFSGTGGWVLKPAGYRADQKPESVADLANNLLATKQVGLMVEVLAAQELPLSRELSKSELYVKCELHAETAKQNFTLPAEKTTTKTDDFKQRTKTIKGYPLNFSGECLTFPQVELVEDMSFLRFKVQDDVVGKDDLIAWSCIRLDRLREGYRFVHLLDAKGLESSAVLLVHIKKRS